MCFLFCFLFVLKMMQHRGFLTVYKSSMIVKCTGLWSSFTIWINLAARVITIITMIIIVGFFFCLFFSLLVSQRWCVGVWTAGASDCALRGECNLNTRVRHVHNHISHCWCTEMSALGEAMDLNVCKLFMLPITYECVCEWVRSMCKPMSISLYFATLCCVCQYWTILITALPNQV